MLANEQQTETIPAEVTIPGQRLDRLVDISTEAMRFAQEVLDEPKGEGKLHEQRAQQRQRDRFMSLVEALRTVEDDDLICPWWEDEEADDDA